jgi:hypothetical protein
MLRIGNCVGQRNHRYFVAFLVFSCVTTWYFCLASTAYMVYAGGVSSKIQDVGALVLCISMLLTACFLSTMATLHVGLVSHAQTLKMRHNKVRLRPACFH